MFGYIGVIILAFAALSVALTVEIRHVLVQQRWTALNRQAVELLPYLQSNQPQTNDASFKQLVAYDEMVDNTKVNILLLEGSNAAVEAKELARFLIDRSAIRNVRALRRVLSGQRVQFVGVFGTVDRATTVTVGVPITQNGRVVGALFLRSAVKGLQLRQIARITFLIALFVMVFSIGVIYAITRRFAGPLGRVTRAVQAFGQGRLHERIPVDGDDEVARLAETFNDMADRLERLEAMRKDLIADVSHELRTPLTSVRGFIQGILDGVIPPEMHRTYLETAYKELQRLNAVLNTMLDLSAIETGHIQLQMASVSWPSVVSDVRDRVQVRMDEKGLVWRESHSHNDITVWADADRLTQVLFNLVDNAIRHTAAGEIAVVSTVVNHQLQVQVSDTGEGIPPDVLPHIWERFYTGGGGKTAGQHRTGLGLTITKLLVERMGGGLTWSPRSARAPLSHCACRCWTMACVRKGDG
ncbi:hypothetical protein GCM10025857_12690 [Alicyclobacillus contaminans]|nr:hypothetical protein GCM10025857_12690 [Alicyclobacillus contaminans]